MIFKNTREIDGLEREIVTAPSISIDLVRFPVTMRSVQISRFPFSEDLYGSDATLWVRSSRCT